jgi:hypothetical protein
METVMTTAEKELHDLTKEFFRLLRVQSSRAKSIAAFEVGYLTTIIKLMVLESDSLSSAQFLRNHVENMRKENHGD